MNSILSYPSLSLYIIEFLSLNGSVVLIRKAVDYFTEVYILGYKLVFILTI